MADVENDVSLRDTWLGPWIGALVSIWQGIIFGEMGQRERPFIFADAVVLIG